MGESHYYDDKTFTTVLKDISGNTSIIYRYDEDHTYLASKTSIYHTTTDISYIRFHNQIMGISGETITHAIGKDIPDVSLNIYTSTGSYTPDISMVNISGIPFIGYYSSENIQGTSDVNVFDLFQYGPQSYVFVPKNEGETTYTGGYKISNTLYENASSNVQLVYTTGHWELYNISDELGNNEPSGLYYLPPIGVDYKYSRVESYNYPTTNVNNLVTSRGESESSDGKPVPNKIPTELVLPELP